MSVVAVVVVAAGGVAGGVVVVANPIPLKAVGMLELGRQDGKTAGQHDKNAATQQPNNPTTN